ncbi:MAG TPA: hypothetical protein DEQ02_09485 [Ruminococcaceae bacterium]|nr:hypothetical protein [Oscillospiraceae bacterium]
MILSKYLSGLDRFSWRHINKHNETVISGFAKTNEAAQKQYGTAMIDYRAQMDVYQHQKMTEYKKELKVFNKQFEESRKSWLEVQNGNIQIITETLNDAQKKRDNLYAVTRLLPKPYQYPEAVFYLYEFLSSSSEDYDIRYALERVDANEMKRMMVAVIQNQQRQAQLFNVIMSSIRAEINRVGNVMNQGFGQISNAVSKLDSAMDQRFEQLNNTISIMSGQIGELGSVSERQLSVAELALNDSRNFLFMNADVFGRLKPLPVPK